MYFDIFETDFVRHKSAYVIRCFSNIATIIDYLFIVVAAVSVSVNVILASFFENVADVISYEADGGIDGLSARGGDGFIAASVILDIMYGILLISRFRTTLLDSERGVETSDLSKIHRQVITSTAFWLDFYSLAPYVYFGLPQWPSIFMRILVGTKAIRGWRLIPGCFKPTKHVFDPSIYFSLMRIMLIILVGGTCTGCIYHAVVSAAGTYALRFNSARELKKNLENIYLLFRVIILFSEMRGKISYIDPENYKICHKLICRIP